MLRIGISKGNEENALEFIDAVSPWIGDARYSSENGLSLMGDSCLWFGSSPAPEVMSIESISFGSYSVFNAEETCGAN